MTLRPIGILATGSICSSTVSKSHEVATKFSTVWTVLCLGNFGEVQNVHLEEHILHPIANGQRETLKLQDCEVRATSKAHRFDREIVLLCTVLPEFRSVETGEMTTTWEMVTVTVTTRNFRGRTPSMRHVQ